MDGQHSEQGGIRAGGGEVDLYAGGLFDDALGGAREVGHADPADDDIVVPFASDIDEVGAFRRTLELRSAKGDRHVFDKQVGASRNTIRGRFCGRSRRYG